MAEKWKPLGAEEAKNIAIYCTICFVCYLYGDVNSTQPLKQIAYWIAVAQLAFVGSLLAIAAVDLWAERQNDE